MILSSKQIKKEQIRLRGCAGLTASLLFTNAEDRFSPFKALIQMKENKHVEFLSPKTKKS